MFAGYLLKGSEVVLRTFHFEGKNRRKRILGVLPVYCILSGRDADKREEKKAVPAELIPFIKDG